MSATKNDENAQLIDKIIVDPILLRKLSDRVYELMLEDLRNTRDRAGNYRGMM
ncbi:hypothetical protein QUB37_13035 [Microcoleus sp. AT3-A2]|uniref:hypothetical protein n=1 Tax=unclassified Microcoleus TaxID=2642155 RepID=UPI002FD468B4